MSGIVGCVRKDWPLGEAAALRMRDSLLHRGPDAGLWSSPAALCSAAVAGPFSTFLLAAISPCATTPAT